MDGMHQTLARITDDPAFAGLKIIDIDTHWSEPHDLWTSRAGPALRNKVPRVVKKGDEAYWVIGEEETIVHRASPASVVGKDGAKIYGGDFLSTNMEQVHAASFDLTERLHFMDRLGIHTQILYPNIGGIGFTYFAVTDNTLRTDTVKIYNDAAIEVQRATNNRVLPMAVIPYWDIDHAVAELERTHKMGMRGVVLAGDVQQVGVPDLGQDYWRPFFEACEAYGVPINFHIGASEVAKFMFEKGAWPKFGPEAHLAVTSCSLYVDNARVIGNLIYSGVLERHPKLKFVSVESGIGWIPFYLEALDYQLVETAPQETSFMTMRPSDYFKRNFYASFWFESGLGAGLKQTIDVLGADNIMFETDFPHPTCLYPDPLAFLQRATVGLEAPTIRKLVQDNAAKLYKIPLS